MLLRVFTEPQEGASYDDQLALARQAEECGFDAFFRSDHFLRNGNGPGDGLPGPTDSWITLAGLARETSRIRLGTLMTSATFRNPGVLAVTVAQVDRMSGGRVELGLGAGWHEPEHLAYGIDFPDTGTRFDRLEEQLELITGLWTTPVHEHYNFAGEHYTVVDSPGLPKPVQAPHPPVIVGGSGRRRTPALAARYAAEFNAAFTSVEETAELFARVRNACTTADREPDSLRLSLAHAVAVGKDDAQVRRRLEIFGADAPWMRDNALAGTPAEVADKLARYREAGVSTVYLQFRDMADLDHLDLIAAEVLPHLVRRADAPAPPALR
ncbi:LLM class F420-dependent oxidoreductase [Actinoplanes aureus]|uniref:LLM class F420-dependent oxidoreductase n=1 Tax=Actinoplanes aureus TaxID=2792083 RepID=A0A931C737_9ACTN|nr:LLM class F420-dependent oxidoreductase [Actinoplanes aureus]MBG0564620.1 LLM class F420-dependent oxidoreductase [Actinoplanes aureus]